MDILTNKSSKTYKRLSRYSVLPTYFDTKRNKWVYGSSTWLDDTTEYSLYLVKKNDTYDSIALEKYNNPTLYWVILNYNKIIDPFSNPIPGTHLRLPVLSGIQFT